MRQCHSLRGPARAARVAVVLVAALASLLLLTPVFAQEQGGAVEGTVRDQSGAGVPGATVEAREARGLVLSATTDAAGLYRFPSLPAGTWEILVQLQGFAPVRRPDVRLALGQLLRVDVALSLSGVQETVTVTEASPVIDVKQSASFATIRDEQIDKLPRGRDFLSLASQAPGATVQNVSAGLSIDGGSGADNRFIIDGIDTTDLQMGVSGKRLITDVIDEVQVKSSGYAAEYGGAIGGVVNVVTKTGTNAVPRLRRGVLLRRRPRRRAAPDRPHRPDRRHPGGDGDLPGGRLLDVGAGVHARGAHRPGPPVVLRVVHPLVPGARSAP